MNDVKEKLNQIFADIPLDGSNIRDDEDDDNGYKISEGNQTVTFEERVSDLSDKMRSAPPTKALPVLEIEKTEPTVKASAEAKLPATPLVAPEPPKSAGEVTEKVPEAVRPTPLAEEANKIADEMETVTSAPLTNVPTTPPSVESSRTEVEEAKGTADDLMKSGEVADESSITPKKTRKPAKVEPEAAVEIEDIRPIEPPDWEVIDGTIVWKLTATSNKVAVADLYKAKRHSLKYILPGGQLPCREYAEELKGATVNPDVSSQNPDEIYEKMQEVQGWRNRVLEIKLEVEHQYFIWRRHMEMMRGSAAVAEGAKGAAVDAAAHKHLPDLEWYWCGLESVVKMADGVMRNLEGAYETLSRQVSILLETRKAASDGTRFERREPEQKSVEKPFVKTTEKQSFDGLDDAATHPSTTNLDGWEVIK